jgi:hypothetical protein
VTIITLFARVQQSSVHLEWQRLFDKQVHQLSIASNIDSLIVLYGKQRKIGLTCLQHLFDSSQSQFDCKLAGVADAIAFATSARASVLCVALKSQIKFFRWSSNGTSSSYELTRMLNIAGSVTYFEISQVRTGVHENSNILWYGNASHCFAQLIDRPIDGRAMLRDQLVLTQSFNQQSSIEILRVIPVRHEGEKHATG